MGQFSVKIIGPTGSLLSGNQHYGYSTRETRAAFLNAIADEIDARAGAITEIGTQETGLNVANRKHQEPERDQYNAA
jgi:hypothetical protein